MCQLRCRSADVQETVPAVDVTEKYRGSMRIPRMDRSDTSVAVKVKWVVGQDSVDPVDLHPSDEPSVMGLNAFYGVFDDGHSSFGINSRGVVQKVENWIEAAQSALGLLDRKA